MNKFKNLVSLVVAIIFFLSLSNETTAQQPENNFADKASILKNISAPVFPDRVIQIQQGDARKGKWNEYINEKINECSGAGGGTVVLAKGGYFCEGPIVFQSNVNLHLDEGVRLYFSQNPKDYLPMVFVRWEGTECYNYSPFIYANNVENIAITGKGTIDGNGLAENSFRDWRSKQKNDQNKIREMGKLGVPVEKRIFGEGNYLRPQLIHFVNCKNILVEDIKVVNGSFWLIQPTYCDNITIRGVRVDSRFINNDGVDLDSDTNVLIENCTFNTGDDFVAIKSGRDQDAWRVNKPCKNIVIQNCISENCLHGISFGSELSGGIENVVLENLIFKKIRQYGLQFKSNKDRGGYLRNIVIDGIQMDSVETCVSFTNQYHSYNGGNSPTAFENISIENVSCNLALDKAVSIIGLPEMPIKNVELKNVNIFESAHPSTISNVENLVMQKVSY